MPGATGNRSYPYPLPTDSINVPRDVQALAEAIDTDTTALAADLATSDAEHDAAILAMQGQLGDLWLQSGHTVSATPAGGTPGRYEVTFPEPFDGVPNAVNVMNGDPAATPPVIFRLLAATPAMVAFDVETPAGAKYTGAIRMVWMAHGRKVVAAVANEEEME
jgi:hypothetical protein